MSEQMRMFQDSYPQYRQKHGEDRALFSSASCEYETPQWLFDQLDKEFHFTLDVCSTDENAKCEKYFTVRDDGLARDCGRETVWCNPPYGRGIIDWVRKCYLHATGWGVLP